MGYKVCRTCKEELEDSEFSNKQHRKLKSGWKTYKSAHCNSCAAKKAIKLREDKPWAWVKYTYKLSDREAMFWYEQTKGTCNICGKSGTAELNKLCIDHDHNTHKIRGVLCKSCNTMLGYAYDDIQILENARFYLIERGG